MTNLHPGLILISTGVIAAILPKKLRKIALACGPLLTLATVLNLSYGVEWTLPFINGYELTPLKVDRLNWVFAMVFTIISVTGGIYSLHNTSWLEALTSMAYAGSAICAVLAGDWLSLIFFWELMALTSLFLILAANTTKSRRAGFRYILVHMLGGNLLLAGIFLKFGQGAISIGNIAAQVDTAFWLIFFGIAINSAIVPLHAWMVDAYPEGTVTGSVFLSSFTSKTAVYCLIRVFAGTDWLMWAGVIMALYGASYALIENNMRRLLSYHIISQVGFMVAGVGIGTDMALNGAAAHAYSVLISKALLFMCTGAIIYTTGIPYINQLGGMAKKLPGVFACFMVAAFSISGVPLFNGFISKSITISAAAEANYPIIEMMLLLASIGTFLSIGLKMVYFIFLAPDRGVVIKRPLPKNMSAAMILAASLCTIYGVFPDLLYNYLPYAMDYEVFTVDHVVHYVQLLGVTMVPFMMYLNHMEPHTAISLDTDWLYRRLFAAIMSGVSNFCCAIQAALSIVWEVLAVGILAIGKNPLSLLGQAPRQSRDTNYCPKAFEPNIYRPMISEPMMIIMTTLLITIAYIAAMR